MKGRIAGALLLCAAGPALASRPPDFPHPRDMQLVVVSDHMIYNGIDMAAFDFTAPSSPDELIRYYRNAWGGRIAESTTQIGLDPEPWTVLSHGEGDYLTTVQLKPSQGGGTYGYIAISNILSGEQHETGRDVLMPAGSKIVNDITSDDLGRRSRTLVIQNENSIDFNLEFYRQHLEDDGWVEVGEASQLSRLVMQPQTLLMNRGDEELNLAISGSGGRSTVVMVRVRK